jgi:hypothetical protein
LGPVGVAELPGPAAPPAAVVTAGDGAPLSAAVGPKLKDPAG